MKNKVRRFYYNDAKGFGDNTEYLEWRGIKNGGMFLKIKGVKRCEKRTDWKLRLAVKFVKNGTWIERDKK